MTGSKRTKSRQLSQAASPLIFLAFVFLQEVLYIRKAETLGLEYVPLNTLGKALSNSICRTVLATVLCTLRDISEFKKRSRCLMMST